MIIRQAFVSVGVCNRRYCADYLNIFDLFVVVASIVGIIRDFKVGHADRGHNYTGHNCIGHNDRDHNYTGHNYIGTRYAALESSRQGGHFEYQHAYTRAIDVPSAMADVGARPLSLSPLSLGSLETSR